MPTVVAAAQHGPCPSALALHIESFAARLSALGYSPVTVRKKRATATSFARWTLGRRLDVTAIDETTIDAFLERSGRRTTPSEVRRYSLAAFLEHLRAEGWMARPEPVHDPSPAALVQGRYERYLRVERGLAQGTVESYRTYVSDFVRHHFDEVATATASRGPDAQQVRDFLLQRARVLPPTRVQLVATALRSFLRFLFLRGETTLDLALAVPTVRHWRQATVHPYLRPEEVERLLGACDLATALGRRDHAILLLLARLGLRAGEVAALEVGDLRWRSGEILVRGKGRRLERLPLVPDVGAALALHLRDDRRPQSPCRRVFLRHDAPRIGLHPRSVGSVVRRALARCGLRPSRCGAHLLRYSLATTMIRSGASMAEIGQVLRHRSPDTTEIYAKLDFAALRAVALPWPGTRGAR